MSDYVRYLERELGLVTSYAGSLANHLRRETTRNAACFLLTLRLARMGDVTDPGGVEDRRTVTLDDLVTQAIAALQGDARRRSGGDG